MLAWLRDPNYTDCSDALMDLSDVKTTPKIGELREVIAVFTQQKPAGGPQRLAVVTSKPIKFAVIRTFGYLVRSRGLPLDVEVFMSLGRAWSWLRPGEPPFRLH